MLWSPHKQPQIWEPKLHRFSRFHSMVPLISSHLRRFGNHQRFPAHRPSPLFKVQSSKFKVQCSPPPLLSGAVAPTCPAKVTRRRKLRAKAERFKVSGFLATVGSRTVG